MLSVLCGSLEFLLGLINVQGCVCVVCLSIECWGWFDSVVQVGFVVLVVVSCCCCVVSCVKLMVVVLSVVSMVMYFVIVLCVMLFVLLVVVKLKYSLLMQVMFSVFVNCCVVISSFVVVFVCVCMILVSIRLINGMMIRFCLVLYSVIVMLMCDMFGVVGCVYLVLKFDSSVSKFSVIRLRFVSRVWILQCCIKVLVICDVIRNVMVSGRMVIFMCIVDSC